MTITTSEQLKAVSDPLRLQILEAVAQEALTVKQIATRLSQPPTKLYYHVSALEEAGFMVVVETRVKSGILEKYYRMAADSLTVDRRLLKPVGAEGEPLQAMLEALFDSTIADLRHSLASGLINLDPEQEPLPKTLILSRSKFTLRPDDVPIFMQKINQLLQEMSEIKETPESVAYACTIAFYPTVNNSELKNKRRTRS